MLEQTRHLRLRGGDEMVSRSNVRIFYRDEYVYDAVEAGVRHLFDVQKPRRIRDALVAGRLAAADDFVSPRAAAEDELLLVHTTGYLAQIREPNTLARLLCLDPNHPWDERLLQPFLFATGGTIAAARAAVCDGVIGVNLAGGYHHAQADKAEGFCALADVAVATRVLQRERLAARVLIVDLDYHHGNGNAEIFREDDAVFTFSIHAGNWCWITKRNNCDVELPAHTTDTTYLEALGDHLPRIIDEFRPDFAIYLAGSDPFVGDTLGDFDISEAGMLRRDQFVTEAVRTRGVPLATVTAGGYGQTSWRIHFNYCAWLLGALPGGDR